MCTYIYIDEHVNLFVCCFFYKQGVLWATWSPGKLSSFISAALAGGPLVHAAASRIAAVGLLGSQGRPPAGKNCQGLLKMLDVVHHS